MSVFVGIFTTTSLRGTKQSLNYTDRTYKRPIAIFATLKLYLSVFIGVFKFISDVELSNSQSSQELASV
jgi:hypothetical protein